MRVEEPHGGRGARRRLGHDSWPAIGGVERWPLSLCWCWGRTTGGGEVRERPRTMMEGSSIGPGKVAATSARLTEFFFAQCVWAFGGLCV